jgi:hypothetical protein
MSDKNELQPNEEELDIIAGARIPTKNELQAMREKFKDDKDIIEALEDTDTID